MHGRGVGRIVRYDNNSALWDVQLEEEADGGRTMVRAWPEEMSTDGVDGRASDEELRAAFEELRVSPRDL